MDRLLALTAAVLSAGLVTAPAPLVTPTPVPPTSAAPGQTAPSSAIPAQAGSATAVPCPYVTRPSLPPTPPSPPRDPAVPLWGGPAMATTGLAVPAGVPAPPTVSAISWVVADLDTGAVLGACAPHLRRRPASVQKLLLAETALPKLDPDLVVEATAEDVALPAHSSAVGLVVGGHYPVSTLWYGLLLESGNDAANALARMAGGTGGVPATLAAMNAEAHRLGADDTHAVTPSGLDAAGQFTSPYDLALIARADFARADFRRYDTMLRFQWPAQPPRDPRGFQIQNENRLLTEYPGGLGGKTGFTDQARHTYVGLAQRGGRRLVVTLMGAEIVPARAWLQGTTLLDWGFQLPATASVGHLVTPEEVAAAHRSAGPAGADGRVREAAAGSGSATRDLLVLLVGLAGLVLVGWFVAWRRIRRAG